jgi:hypothetical protein
MVTLKYYERAFPHTYQKIDYRTDSVYDVLSSGNSLAIVYVDVSRREELVVFNSLEVMMSLIVTYAYVYHLEFRIIGSLSRTRSGAGPSRRIKGVTVTVNATVTNALRVSFRVSTYALPFLSLISPFFESLFPLPQDAISDKEKEDA